MLRLGLVAVRRLTLFVRLDATKIHAAFGGGALQPHELNALSVSHFRMTAVG